MVYGEVNWSGPQNQLLVWLLCSKSRSSQGKGSKVAVTHKKAADVYENKMQATFKSEDVSSMDALSPKFSRQG